MNRNKNITLVYIDTSIDNSYPKKLIEALDKNFFNHWNIQTTLNRKEADVIIECKQFLLTVQLTLIIRKDSIS